VKKKKNQVSKTKILLEICVYCCHLSNSF